MEPVTTIQVTCRGAETVDLSELLDLQGNLKDLSEENYVKLRNSLVEYGFSFPVFFWQDQEGKKWILDAHQRTRTLRKMQNEGIVIPLLPADPIFAKDKTEAKKKLLLLNSRYGHMTREGFDEFIDDPSSLITEAEIIDLLTIPEIEAYEKKDTPQKEKSVSCPSCGHTFTL